MKSEPNPLYRAWQPWILRGPALWVWRALLMAIVIALLLTGSYLGAGVFAAMWFVAEVLTRRQARL